MTRLCFSEGQRLLAAALELPTSAITKIEPDKAYYVRLRFNRADDSEITQRSVQSFTAASLERWFQNTGEHQRNALRI